MLTQYKNILSKIFDIVQNSYDETLLLVSLDTIGYLGATRDGKFALNNNRMFKDAIIQKTKFLINFLIIQIMQMKIWLPH